MVALVQAGFIVEENVQEEIDCLRRTRGDGGGTDSIAEELGDKPANLDLFDCCRLARGYTARMAATDPEEPLGVWRPGWPVPRVKTPL